MTLSLALNNALSGLNINQQSLSVLSQNIANANTKGYSRKIINQSAIYLDGRGSGVSIESVSRKVDQYLLRSVRLQGSVVGRNETLVDYADRTQLLLGKPGSQNSLPSFIGNFFNSMQTLAQTPENSTLRVGAVNSASSLARELRTLSQSLQEMRLQSESDISQSISVINATLRDIQGLNTTIVNDGALGKGVGELLDRRDLALATLSQYLDIDTFELSNGRVNIFTGSGVSLLDENVYQLSYQPQSSTQSFINDAVKAPINVFRLNDSGQLVGNPVQLVSGGTSAQVSSGLVSGKLRALIDLRDKQVPNLLSQLDQVASRLRDEFNRVHNNGIGFPGANNYTGTRSVNASSASQWAGKMRLALLDNAGRPVSSPYPGENSGIRPLQLDFSKLDTGSGPGFPTVQGIIDEINQHYGPPQNKAVIGNLNNIRLASNNASMPGNPPQLNFDFDVENISGGAANFFVTGVQVLDNNGVDITNTTQTIPQVNLAGTNTYSTTDGSSLVTVRTSANHGFQEGQTIYLSSPPGSINGIDGAQLGGFFTITNVTGDSFQIQASSPATATGPVDVAGQNAKPPYKEVAAGEYGRTTDRGTITANLSANPTALYYTVRVNVAVKDADGNLTTSQISYQVDNNQPATRNRRYSTNAVSGGGQLVPPSSNQGLARAILVDSNGVELPRINGQYTNQQNGFLKLVAENPNHSLGIDSLDSVELGNSTSIPAVAGAGRGFSYFFELNNFFKRFDNNGDSVTNSALNLDIEQRLISNPNLLSLGTLRQSARPADPNLPPLYTYERNVGDNNIIQQLAGISSSVINFSAAGGLSQSSTTFGNYAGSIIGAAATNTSSSDSELQNAKSLLAGFSDRSDSISGVNLDEELANTVIYQNAYTASTRVITVVSELFDTLLNSFGR
ncbi:MAG: flagellar hook-associated protein FlgK [Rickettsiales bacterium]|jgi:flagellar hook-associated protein 1 FlgK|nr:flagellar hook-associated protein FlgK [Rickettsiales bacterium]